MTAVTVKCPRPAAMLAILFLIMAWTPRAWADQIVLDNGDRISGQIISISDDKIQVATDYAGEIGIDFSRVVDMKSDRVGRIMLENGDIIIGRIDSISEGEIAVSSETLGRIRLPRAQLQGYDAREVVSLEEERQPEEPEHEAAVWSGSFSVGGQLQRGNTDTADLHVEAKAKRTAARDELHLRFYSDYGETDGETDSNKVFGQAKLKVFYAERRYVFGLTDMEYDEMENLDLRAQVFGGLGRIFIDEERSNLLGEVGTGLTGEFFDDEGDEETLEASLWFNVEYRRSLFESLEFYQALTLQPSLGDIGDFRLRSESTLTAPLGNNWAIKFSLIDDYDSAPEAEDTEKNDLRLISSAEYTF